MTSCSVAAAANRGPVAFTDPDRFDITRDNTVGTLSFGNGAHYCLGSHLARLELTQALTVMAQRMPNLRRTGSACRIRSDTGMIWAFWLY